MQLNNKHYVWLDCDPGLDDTMAIVLAAKTEQIQLLGVSTSAGNTSIENTTKNALDILHNIQRSDVPVVRGSAQLIHGVPHIAQHMHGSGGLGGVVIQSSPKKPIEENSFKVICDYIMSCPQKVIWANTGALTNLCFLFRKHPQVKTKIDKIVIMGGAIGKGNITPAAEFNIFFDPQAYRQVLQMKQNIPLVMIPLQVTHQVQAYDKFFTFLQKRSQVPFVLAILKMLRSYQVMYKKSQNFDHPPIHDPTVINYILHPNHFQVKKAFIDVDIGKTSYGRTNCYFRDLHDPSKQSNSIDLVALKMTNRSRFWGMFEKIFENLFKENQDISSPIKKSLQHNVPQHHSAPKTEQTQSLQKEKVKVTKNKHYVWLDCDPGLDDTMAIVLAAQTDQIQLLGVSTSAGNTSIDNTTKNALDILYNIQRSDVPVVRGSQTLVDGVPRLAELIHGVGGLGGVVIQASPKKAITQNNFEAIRDYIMNSPQKVVWANTGALTNLCFLFRKHPEVKSKIEQIVLMGGAVGKGNVTPAAEFNIFFDPQAYRQVLKTKQNIPLVMIPLQVTHQVQAQQKFFKFLQTRNQSPFVLAVYKMLKSYQVILKQCENLDYPPIHDPTVINYILHPTHFEVKKAIIDVDVGKISYGRTNCYFKDPNNRKIEAESIDLVALKMSQRGKFWQMFQKIFKKLFKQNQIA